MADDWFPEEDRRPDRRDDYDRDPERGQHFVWIILALVITVIAWYW